MNRGVGVEEGTGGYTPFVTVPVPVDEGFRWRDPRPPMNSGKGCLSGGG